MTEFPAKALESGELVISIGTHLDNSNAPVLLDQLMAAIDNNRLQIILDMKDCELLSSSGVGAIISSVEAARSLEGEITLVQPSEAVLVILDTLGLTKMLTIQRTRQDIEQGAAQK